MSLKKALLVATVLALPMAANAQPVSGPYVAGGAGANWRLDSTGSLTSRSTTAGTTTTTNSNFKVKSETGYAFVGSVGWGFGNGLRAELEGNYRDNEASKTSVRGARVAGSAGQLRTYGVMVNALYDFTMIPLPIVPYVGAGVGYGWSDWTGSPLLGHSDRDGALAYQGIVGASYAIPGVPGLALTLEGRYYGTTKPELSGTTRTTTTATTNTIKPSNDNISAMIGLRYALWAPAPAPVRAAAPAAAAPAAPGVARTYLVFFDWDRADLTARAREIITEAAANARRANVTRIEVAGHADRSGDAAYNQRLSQRRAEAVAAELVRQGIARNAITVQAFGESRPLVPTADGVREPQNRRVEIVLR